LLVPQGISDSHFMRMEIDRNHLRVQKVFDVEPVLKKAAELRQIHENSRGYNESKTQKHIGLIPGHIWPHMRRAAGGDELLYLKMQ